jgi:hypothetical protein
MIRSPIFSLVFLGAMMGTARADFLFFFDQQLSRSSLPPTSAPPGIPTQTLHTTGGTGIFAGLPQQDFPVTLLPAPPPDQFDSGIPFAPLTQFQISDAAFGSFTATTTGNFDLLWPPAGHWLNPSQNVWQTTTIEGVFVPGTFFAPLGLGPLPATLIEQVPMNGNLPASERLTLSVSVPEPSTLVMSSILFGIGGVGLVYRRFKKTATAV